MTRALRTAYHVLRTLLHVLRAYARERYPTGWWDPTRARLISSTVLVAWGAVLYARPNLPIFYPTYSAFDDIMSAATWTNWLVLTGLLSIIALPGSVTQLVSQFSNTIAFLLLAAAYTQGIGPTPETATHTILAGVSLILFGKGVRDWLLRRPTYHRIAGTPPAWFPQRKEGQ